MLHFSATVDPHCWLHAMINKGIKHILLHTVLKFTIVVHNGSCYKNSSPKKENSLKFTVNDDTQRNHHMNSDLKHSQIYYIYNTPFLFHRRYIHKFWTKIKINVALRFFGWTVPLIYTDKFVEVKSSCILKVTKTWKNYLNPIKIFQMTDSL